MEDELEKAIKEAIKSDKENSPKILLDSANLSLILGIIKLSGFLNISWFWVCLPVTLAISLVLVTKILIHKLSKM